jgi:hypothetical protein
VAANAVLHAAWVVTLFTCQMYQVSLTVFCDEAHHMFLWLVPAHLFHSLRPCVNSEMLYIISEIIIIPCMF